MTPPQEGLRVAVIGVGHLGHHHARLYASMPGCRLVAVVDRDLRRAREVAACHSVAALDDVRRLEGKVDAVSVAVPTQDHAQVALPLLGAGVPVLIEKPLAASLADADEMIDAARRTDTLLAVGHTERFNPAVEAMEERASNPRFIESHRLGSFSPRSLDIDVVLDLMIHDIDIALALVKGSVRSIQAIGVAALTSRPDLANVRMVFESGCVANLTASRISATRTRKIRVFQDDSYLSCDCAKRSLEYYRLQRSSSTTRPTIAHDVVKISDEEPLLRELLAFTAAVRGEAPFPVTGETGRAALELALRIGKTIDSTLAKEPSHP